MKFWSCFSQVVLDVIQKDPPLPPQAPMGGSIPATCFWTSIKASSWDSGDVFELPAVKLDDFPKVRGENKTYQLATTVTTTTTTTATTTAHDQQILTPSRKYTQFRPLYLVPLFPYIRQYHDDPGDPQVDCRILNHYLPTACMVQGCAKNLPRPTKTLHCN